MTTFPERFTKTKKRIFAEFALVLLYIAYVHDFTATLCFVFRFSLYLCLQYGDGEDRLDYSIIMPILLCMVSQIVGSKKEKVIYYQAF